MKRSAIARRALLLAAASLFGASPAAAQATKPQRVASINLSADEVLVEILPPGRLVSVTRWADAEGTSNVVGRVPKSVHRFVKADMEQLVALEPDLVVVSEYTDADFMKQLERSGLRVHRMLGLSTLAGVRGAILDLGRAVGEDEAARRLVAAYDAMLAELNRRLTGATKPRVLYWSGNMTAGADRSFTYNLENKPLTITIGGQTTTFVYDGDNGRVKKVVGSATTRYISQLYECENASCSRMIFAGSERVATLAPSGGVQYYHPDHLGSSSVITDGTGATVQALTYFPYGATRTNSGRAYAGKALVAKS